MSRWHVRSSNSKGKEFIKPNKAKLRAAVWGCELLETRRLLATVSWITQGSGNWSVGSNWSTGAPPQPGDDVIIYTPGVNSVVTYNAPSGTLALGNLTLDEGLILDGAGGATWTGGTINGSGIINNDTTLTISGSANKYLEDGIELDNLPAATITVSGSGDIIGEVGATINNLNGLAGPGTFIVESDMEITFPTGIGDGVFNNDGLFEKTAGGTAPGDMTEIGGAQGFTFNNDGDCQVQQGTLGLGDDVNISESTGEFDVFPGATLEYLRGTEEIVSTPTSLPVMNGPNGTLLMTGGNVTSYGYFIFDTVDMEAGSLLLDQNMASPGGASANTDATDFCPAGNVNNLNISGGTIGGDGGGIFSVGTTTIYNNPGNPPTTPAGPFATTSGQPVFQQAPGTFQLPALVVSDTFSWTSGTIEGSGRMVLDSTITSATISTTEPKDIEGDDLGGFGLDTLLPLIWTGSGTIGVTGGSAIIIEPTGEFWDQGNGTITANVGGAQGTGYIINEGNFLKEDGTGTTLIGTGMTFVNDFAGFDDTTVATYAPTGPQHDLLYQVGGPTLAAQLDIQTGTLEIDGNSVNTNDYTIVPGATLSFQGGGQDLNGTANPNVNNLNFTAKILGGNFEGTINFGDCTFTADDEARLNIGTANFSVGTYDFENIAGGAQVVQVGTFTGGGSGVIGGAGTLEVAQSFQWISGTFTGTGNSPFSELLIDSGATLTMTAGDFQTTNDYSVDNEGTIEWGTSPGTLTIDGNFEQTSGGTFDCEIVQGVPDSLTVAGTITLAGTFNLTTDSYTPAAGETYTIIGNIGGAAISGIFAGLPEGTVFTVGTDTYEVTYLGGAGADSMVLTSIVKPVITIETPNVLVRPLSGTTLMNFTVELSVASSEVVTVHYATSPGTAVAGVDYDSTSGTLTFPAGTTRETISVTIIGTSAIEAPVTFTVTLSDPTLSTLGTPSSAVGTVASLNGPPVLSFSESAYVVDEDAGFATVIVVSSDSSIPSTVSYQTVDGTAIAGVDYTATSGVLVFDKGTSQVSFTVPIINLGLESGQKTFSIVLSNPTGTGATIGLGTTVVGILENALPKPSISIDNATVTELVEGQTPAVFTLTLSSAYTAPVSVQYATVSGTAVEGKYVAQSGTLTLQPGQTTATISIEVNSDFVQSTTETFSVVLSDPVNVTLANTTGIGTILSQTLTTLQISAGHSFRYLDAAGHRTTISLAGPGVGTISYLGLTTVDGKQIVLNGTTAATRLSISTNGGPAHIVNIIVNGSLGAINAPTTDLQGDVAVAGSLQTLHMASLLGGNTVSVGAGSGVLNAAFANVTNSTFSSGVPLGVVHVTSWLDATSGGGISAPSARQISVAGVFNSSVALTGDLGALSVRGGLNNSTIRVDGNIGTVTAGTMFDSDIFAGVLSSVTTLPTATSAFADASSTIKSVAVASHALGAYAGSIIAAPVVGNVQLGSVNPSNGGNPFGVAGSSIHLVQARVPKATKLTDASLTTRPFSDTDLEIRLVT